MLQHLWFANKRSGAQSPAAQGDSCKAGDPEICRPGQVTMLQTVISPSVRPLEAGREGIDLPDSEAGWVFGERQVNKDTAWNGSLVRVTTQQASTIFVDYPAEHVLIRYMFSQGGERSCCDAVAV